MVIWVRPGTKKVELILGIAQPDNGVLTQFRLTQPRFKEWLDREESRTVSR